MLSFRFTVIGAGAAGLAVARALSLRYHGENDVLVVEKERSFGKGISSRNSEVIHSGLYYPTGSLKHRLCIEGRRALYRYCAQKNILHRKCGKLIVADGSAEESELEALFHKSRLNEVENVRRLTKAQAVVLEPDVNAGAALLLEETGILDSHSFMKSLESEVIRDNGTVSYDSEVVAVEYERNAYAITLKSGDRFSSDSVINAGGLAGTGIAGLLGLRPATMHPCKGSYFSYSGSHSVKHLVYPIPEKGLAGLGVHATIDLAGRLRFGPDVEYVDAVDDFTVDERKQDAFYDAARRLFPGFKKDGLHPDQAGIRPKLQGPGDHMVKDFYIREESDKGFPGFVNLLGIESPGLTASLAIGEHVQTIVMP
ncbi:MAG: NAD(P)/FAD-dependent oxidoreductase [Candidatus Edwardsbacteria bacterium]|nr:NAD(P)/FAD-dependent oxidoreductase [Candidatus Edwardsbacteria bacterium]